MGIGIHCCHGCTKRWVTKTDTCHSNCKDYHDEKIKYEEDKAQIRKSKEFDDYLIKRNNKRRDFNSHHEL